MRRTRLRYQPALSEVRFFSKWLFAIVPLVFSPIVVSACVGLMATVLHELLFRWNSALASVVLLPPTCLAGAVVYCLSRNCSAVRCGVTRTSSCKPIIRFSSGNFFSGARPTGSWRQFGAALPPESTPGGPVNHSESSFCSCSWTELSALPRWRTGRGAAGHKLVSHAQQASQHIAIDARQANEHGVVGDVVVRHVVNIGVRNEQLRAILEIHADDQRAGFGRAMRGDASQEFSVDLECRRPVRGALLDARQSKSDLPYRLEVDRASGHWLSF